MSLIPFLFIRSRIKVYGGHFANSFAFVIIGQHFLHHEVGLPALYVVELHIVKLFKFTQFLLIKNILTMLIQLVDLKYQSNWIMQQVIRYEQLWFETYHSLSAMRFHIHNNVYRSFYKFEGMIIYFATVWLLAFLAWLFTSSRLTWWKCPTSRTEVNAWLICSCLAKSKSSEAMHTHMLNRYVLYLLDAADFQIDHQGLLLDEILNEHELILLLLSLHFQKLLLKELMIIENRFYESLLIRGLSRHLDDLIITSLDLILPRLNRLRSLEC